MGRTFEEVVKIKDELEKYYAPLYTQFDILSDVYNQRMSLGKMPSDVEIYRPPTARKHIDAAVDHLMGLKQKVDVMVWSDSQEAGKMATELKRFGEGVLQWIDRSFRVSIRRSCYKNGFLFGMFVLKGPLYIPRIKPDGMEQEQFDASLKNTFPMLLKSIPPKTIIMSPTDPPQFIIEKYTKKAIAVKEAWPEWDGKDANNKMYEDMDDIIWWEYWSADEKKFVVGDKPILEEENPYGFIPYEIGYGGFGVDSWDGKPEDLIVSLIAPAISTYKIESRNKTALSYGLEFGVWGRPSVDNDEGVLWADAPGEMTVMPQSAGFQYLAPPQATPDVYRMIDMLRNDQNTVSPSTLQGIYPEGVSSGYMGAMSIGQARLQYDGLKSQWETAISRTLDKILTLTTDIIQEPIGINGLYADKFQVQSIDYKKIIPAIMHYNVMLDGETPEQLSQRIMLGQRFLSMNPDTRGLSTQTIIEEFLGKDWETEQQRSAVEAIMRNPAVQMGMAQEAMKAWGMNELLKAIQQGQVQLPGQGQQRQTHPYEQNPNYGTQGRAQEDYMRTKQRLGPTGETMSNPEIGVQQNEGFGQE